jgi:hypothetical protein
MTNMERYARCEMPKPFWASFVNGADVVKPLWVKRMAMRRRKTLVVCQKCHEEIHRERPSRRTSAAQITGKPT